MCIEQLIRKHKQRLLFLLIFLTAVIFLSACGGAPAEEPAAQAEPAAPEEPVEPEEPSEGLPVTYGQDSRIEVFQHTDLKLREMAASVAIFVHKDRVKISGDSVTLDGHTLDDMSKMGWLVQDAKAPMCDSELFASQIAPGFCTGFLVEDDLLVTAGHCLQKTPCSDINIVFGFQMESGNLLAAIPRKSVFKCAEVLAQEIPNPDNRYLDYAIIKLDRPTGRAGLDYAFGGHLGAQDPVAVIGYPSGLPQKIASDASVISNTVEHPFFVTNLDTFGSNSGSPVINTETYQVEGILVRGMPDYVLSEDSSCIRVNRCPDSGGVNCAGENATKMAVLEQQIQESIATASNGLNCFPNLLVIFGLVTLVRKKTL